MLLSPLKWKKLLHFIILPSFGVKPQCRRCGGNPRDMEFTESSEADSPGDGKYTALVLLCSQLPPVMDLPDPSGLWCLSVSPQHPLLYQSGEALKMQPIFNL